MMTYFLFPRPIGRCLIRINLFLFVVVIIYFLRTYLFPPKIILSSPSIHLLTGLLVDHQYAWNGDDNRKDETGLWLLDPLLDHINKTVYNSDLLLTPENILSLTSLNRFAEQSWQESILKSLSNRADIDLRPIAQYKKSQECRYYLTYIIDHYEHLPEIILFSHGQPQSHNPNLIQHWSWFIEQVQQDQQRQFFNASIGFLSVNCGIYIRKHTRSRPILDLLGYNRTINPLANQIRVLRLGTYCCAQFIVHRSRILQHPISFWRLALKLVIDLNDCSHFEYLWHVFFGEADELNQQKTLPLWYSKAHPQSKEQCSTQILID